MTTIKHPLSISAAFLWMGFVCAISFMEAWLKFRAPGITIPLGLGIGRLVFDALNKVEWIFAIAIALEITTSKIKTLQRVNLLYVIPVIVLLIQTIWLLPALDERAELHIQGQNVPASSLHFYYVGMEFIKVLCLLVFALSNFKIKNAVL
jgi:hypothetical protein